MTERTRWVTQRDLARAVGVSINTVSRALNGKPDIHPATKERILAAAERLGYRPNKLARGLRANKTGTIGVIVTDIANPYFSTLVKEIVKTAWPCGYSVVLQGTDEDYSKEREAVRLALAEQVEGVLLAPTQRGTETVDELKASGIPFVLMSRYFADVETDYVIMDDLRGGFLACQYLIQQGHSRIAVVNGPLHISSAVERYEGHKRGLAAYGVQLDESLVVPGALTMDDGYRAAQRLLRRKAPTAIFAFSDFVAFGVLRALRERGIRVPADVAVVGFDDIPFASCLETPLTTVGGSKETLGREATTLLINRLGGEKEQRTEQIRLPVRLLVRRQGRRSKASSESANWAAEEVMGREKGG